MGKLALIFLSLSCVVFLHLVAGIYDRHDRRVASHLARGLSGGGRGRRPHVNDWDLSHLRQSKDPNDNYNQRRDASIDHVVNNREDRRRGKHGRTRNSYREAKDHHKTRLANTAEDEKSKEVTSGKDTYEEKVAAGQLFRRGSQNDFLIQWPSVKLFEKK